MDQASATHKFYEYNNSIAIARKKSVKAAACSCYGDQIRAHAKDQIKSAGETPVYSGQFVGGEQFCTKDDQCWLPGQSCVNQVCHFLGEGQDELSKLTAEAFSKVRDKAGEQAAEVALKTVLNSLSDGFGTAIEEMLDSVGLRIAKGIVASAPLGSPLEIYSSSASRAKNNLANLHSLYQEFFRAQNNGNLHRAPSQIESDIKSAKDSLREDLSHLATSYDEVRKNYIPENKCEEAFSESHKAIANIANAMLAMPDRIPQ